ncbi:putative Sex-lethal like protein [Blattamonas nauphoetae]|uniref:Sex-lethal like protein n=1 Tax=Blattamonas nauphoetae TaxID=2049346 RepID=A0ABQ9WW64_9EUKA|nr:putative Sex-lethal like protein [Blattamonas nauphoetae]
MATVPSIPPGAYRIPNTDQIRIDNPCRLIVNYVPQNFDQDAFHNLLSPYGTIVYCKLIVDKKTNVCLGYGFVEFSRPEEASDCISQLNGLQVLNKRLKVSYSRNPNPDMKNANVYIAGYGPDLRPDQLESIFSNYGSVINMNMLKDEKGISRGAAFVRMNSHTEAVHAVSNLNGAKIMGRIIYAKISNAQIHNPTNRNERGPGGPRQGGGRRGRGGMNQQGGGFPQDGGSVAFSNQQMGAAQSQLTAIEVSNVPSSLTDNDLRNVFAQFQPTGLYRKDQQAGANGPTSLILTFNTPQEAFQARHLLDGGEIEQHRLGAVLCSPPPTQPVATQRMPGQ